MKSIFQRIADFLNRKSPKWFVDLTDYLLQVVILPTLEALGKEAIDLLMKLIVDAAGKDWTDGQKRKWVFDEFKSRYNVQDIKDRTIMFWIEALVNKLKEQKIIK